MKKIIINLHQYKTGGKTLEGIFYRKYKSKLLYINKLRPINNNDLVSNRIENLINKKVDIDYKVVTGHMFFGAHRYFEDKDCTYATTLRDPISRAISYYYYMITTSLDNEITKYILFNKMNIEEFLMLSKDKISNLKLSLSSKEELLMILSNGQSHLIAGTERINSDSLYDEVKANLSNFFIHVGVTEKFDQSLVILANKIGIKQYFYFKSNVGNYTIGQENESFNISENTIRIFNNNNKVDRKIHLEAMNDVDYEIETKKSFYQIKINRLNKSNLLQKTIRSTLNILS